MNAMKKKQKGKERSSSVGTQKKLIMKGMISPHRTQVGTGSRLRTDIHSNIFEGLDNSE